MPFQRLFGSVTSTEIRGGVTKKTEKKLGLCPNLGTPPPPYFWTARSKTLFGLQINLKSYSKHFGKHFFLLTQYHPLPHFQEMEQ